MQQVQTIPLQPDVVVIVQVVHTPDLVPTLHHHRQPALESVGLPAGSLPESERAAAEVLALPITSRLTPEDAEDVVGAIGAFYRG